MRPKEALKNKGIKFVPRTMEAQKICGVYESSPPPLFNLYERQYEGKKNRPSFGSWLVKNGLEQNQVKNIVEAVNTKKFVVSCRYNDILRVGNSPHYESCLKNDPGKDNPLFFSRGHIPTLYCSLLPELVVAFLPDKAGKFKCRIILLVKGNYILPLRAYGSVSSVTKMLHEIIGKHPDYTIAAPSEIQLTDNYVYLDYGVISWKSYINEILGKGASSWQST
jgi:hypothetical protein